MARVRHIASAEAYLIENIAVTRATQGTMHGEWRGWQGRDANTAVIDAEWAGDGHPFAQPCEMSLGGCIAYGVGTRAFRVCGHVGASSMIADGPPFYVKFVRSLLERRRMARLQTAMPQTVEAVSVKLLPKPDVKRLPDPATALRALPVPEQPVQDVLSLPDRDCLRRVVPDFDHLEYGD